MATVVIAYGQRAQTALETDLLEGLASARRLSQYLDLVRAGQWDSVGAGTIRRLRGQTLGLAGFGRIGQATGAKALGLGLRVLVCDPFRPAADIAEAGAEPVDWPPCWGSRIICPRTSRSRRSPST